MTLDELRRRFRRPETDDRVLPFWFWNDDLDDAEIRRQIADFHAHGVGGFVIHPRLGLAREVGYLTPRWFAHCRTACAEARARGLRVVLYDEAMYPSGVGGGLVTRDRPDLRARGLQRVVLRLDGPQRRYWRPAPGEWFDDRLVAARLVAPDGSAQPLKEAAHGLVRLDVGPGAWRAEAFLNVPSGGHSRGVFVGEDDCDAGAIPSADLLNPAATSRFLATTHEAYATALGEFFGETIVAFFTDEPSLLGRGARRGGLVPWTDGLERCFAQHEGCDLLPRLAALFDESEPDAADTRERFARVVARRLGESFYQPLANWCAAHGLALVGHPEHSDDLDALRWFTWPGQDTVWRWVLPGPTATEGPHSTAARCATSARRLYGRARAASEIAGAYGWELTCDELKWLFDWHLARGNDLFFPHAFYYSLRGPRGQERPPDLGPGNTWWPWFGALADYVARVCALLRVGTPRVATALAADPRHLPPEPAAILAQRQVDFDYVPADAAELLARYEYVVTDEESARRAPNTVLVASPPCPDLRAWRVSIAGLEVFLLANEGEAELAASVWLPVRGALEAWDPWTGAMAPAGASADGSGLRAWLCLARRQTLVWVVDPAGAPEPAAAPEARWRAVGELADWSWRPRDEWVATALGDWCRERELETFSGTVAYRCRVTTARGRYRLDLGAVGELAELAVDGVTVGARLWAPYRFDLALDTGEHELVVRVTNSAANARCGSLRPSGLLGPVVWSVADG